MVFRQSFCGVKIIFIACIWPWCSLGVGRFCKWRRMLDMFTSHFLRYREHSMTEKRLLIKWSLIFYDVICKFAFHRNIFPSRFLPLSIWFYFIARKCVQVFIILCLINKMLITRLICFNFFTQSGRILLPTRSAAGSRQPSARHFL